MLPAARAEARLSLVPAKVNCFALSGQAGYWLHVVLCNHSCSVLVESMLQRTAELPKRAGLVAQ